MPTIDENDSKKLLSDDMYLASASHGSYEHLSIISENVTDSISWIIDTTGAQLSDKIYHTNGHSVSRSTLFADSGVGLITKMTNTA